MKVLSTILPNKKPQTLDCSSGKPARHRSVMNFIQDPPDRSRTCLLVTKGGAVLEGCLKPASRLGAALALLLVLGIAGCSPRSGSSFVAPTVDSRIESGDGATSLPPTSRRPGPDGAIETTAVLPGTSQSPSPTPGGDSDDVLSQERVRKVLGWLRFTRQDRTADMVVRGWECLQTNTGVISPPPISIDINVMPEFSEAEYAVWRKTILSGLQEHDASVQLEAADTVALLLTAAQSPEDIKDIDRYTRPPVAF